MRRIAALLLLACWLPAVMHCQLEAAGISFGSDCCAENSNEPASHDCAGDACDVIEGEFTKSTSGAVKPVAPCLSASLLCAFAVSPVVTPFALPGTGIVEAETAPPEIIASRHFLARTALPSRAPDCAS